MRGNRMTIKTEITRTYDMSVSLIRFKIFDEKNKILDRGEFKTLKEFKNFVELMRKRYNKVEIEFEKK